MGDRLSSGAASASAASDLGEVAIAATTSLGDKGGGGIASGGLRQPPRCAADPEDTNPDEGRATRDPSPLGLPDFGYCCYRRGAEVGSTAFYVTRPPSSLPPVTAVEPIGVEVAS